MSANVGRRCETGAQCHRILTHHARAQAFAAVATGTRVTRRDPNKVSAQRDLSPGATGGRTQRGPRARTARVSLSRTAASAAQVLVQATPLTPAQPPPYFDPHAPRKREARLRRTAVELAPDGREARRAVALLWEHAAPLQLDVVDMADEPELLGVDSALAAWESAMAKSGQRRAPAAPTVVARPTGGCDGAEGSSCGAGARAPSTRCEARLRRSVELTPDPHEVARALAQLRTLCVHDVWSNAAPDAVRPQEGADDLARPCDFKVKDNAAAGQRTAEKCPARCVNDNGIVLGPPATSRTALPPKRNKREARPRGEVELRPNAQTARSSLLLLRAMAVPGASRPQDGAADGTAAAIERVAKEASALADSALQRLDAAQQMITAALRSELAIAPGEKCSARCAAAINGNGTVLGPPATTSSHTALPPNRRNKREARPRGEVELRPDAQTARSSLLLLRAVVAGFQRGSIVPRPPAAVSQQVCHSDCPKQSPNDSQSSSTNRYALMTLRSYIK